MDMLFAIFVITVGCAFGVGWLGAALRFHKRLGVAEDSANAAHEDAAGLAVALQGLQEALAAGMPVDATQINPGMPRSEALLLEALERDLRRPLPLRIRRSIRRAERAASQT